MARGNDSQAALADLRGNYAAAANAVGNAEDLISSSRLAVNQEMRTALLLPVNEKATEEILESLDDVDKAVGSDATVVDAAVRGPFVVAVCEAESGRKFKQVFSAAEFGVDVRRNEKALARQIGDETEDQAAEREAAEQRMREVAEAASEARDADEAARQAEEKARASRAKQAEKKSSSKS